jgi:hypothetical protein
MHRLGREPMAIGRLLFAFFLTYAPFGFHAEDIK